MFTELPFVRLPVYNRNEVVWTLLRGRSNVILTSRAGCQ